MDLEELYALTRRADEMLQPSLGLRERFGMTDSVLAKHIREVQSQASLAVQIMEAFGGADRLDALNARVEAWRRHEKASQLIDGRSSTLTRAAQNYLESSTMRAATGYIDSPPGKIARDFVESERLRRSLEIMDDPAFRLAREAAERAQAFALPTALAQFQATTKSLTERLSLLDPALIAGDSFATEAFARSAAVSDALALATKVDRDLIEATQAYAQPAMPRLESLAAHRAFLDASGLWLPHWPRVRLLTASEKRRRFRGRLQRNAESRNVKRAKSLVHQYERVLREILDAAMAETYGEDWAKHRLPECGCKTLLGRAEARGGDPLEYADYAHYRLIMSHPEHHAEVFSIAFDDPEALAQLIDDAGRLRARSHHAGQFTPEDLRDLRLVWRTIEAGLLALTEDFDFDWGP